MALLPNLAWNPGVADFGRFRRAGICWTAHVGLELGGNPRVVRFTVSTDLVCCAVLVLQSLDSKLSAAAVLPHITGFPHWKTNRVLFDRRDVGFKSWFVEWIPIGIDTPVVVKLAWPLIATPQELTNSA